MNDYYYIVWNKKGGGKNYEAIAFSPGTNPVPWCDAILAEQATKHPPPVAGHGYDHKKEQYVSYEKPRRMTIGD